MRYNDVKRCSFNRNFNAFTYKEETHLANIILQDFVKNAHFWGQIFIGFWMGYGVMTSQLEIEIQVILAMSTSRISILSLMSKWFFIPNIFSIYIFTFQLLLCRKWLTWSNGYPEVIFHALDIFSITFATAYVRVKNRLSQGWRIVCFGYVHALWYLRYENLPNNGQKQLKWYNFFWLSN